MPRPSPNGPPSYQLGISAITCPGADTSNVFAHCTEQFVDSTETDRPWITSDGPTVYLEYHDSGESGRIHVQRSDDDGFTWQKVADPIVGNGSATGGSTYNNSHGPIVADPRSHNVYLAYVAGSSDTKANQVLLNKVYVARSTDRGKSWTSKLVYEGRPDVSLDNFWPSLDVDPATGAVYTAWTDQHKVMVSRSADGDLSWSSPLTISASPVNTAVMPWVVAQNGTVDIAYYGTSGSSVDDRSAAWDVYLARSVDGGRSFSQTRVSPSPNHLGPICVLGSDCSAWRQLADLFEVDVDPSSGRAAITYTSDNLGHPFTVTSGPLKGQQFLSAEAGFTRAVLTLPDQELNGPTTYVGPVGCGSGPAPPAPADTNPDIDQITLVLAQSGCRFDNQAQAVLDAGYEGFVELLVGRDSETQMVGAYRDLPGLSVNQTTSQALLGVTDFSQLHPGTKGPNVSVGARRPQLVLAQQNR